MSLMVPCGRLQSACQTANTIRRHRAMLNKAGFSFELWFGGNKNMSYREYSALVYCSFIEAQILATKLKQNAFYWLENHKLTLIETKSLRQLRLPQRFSERRVSCLLPKTNQAIQA